MTQPEAKMRILVAEDDAVSRELLCARLRRWGYEVISTQNGTEAMAAIEKVDSPSLAVLDCMMPGMDGLEVCRRTRALGNPVYIILLTACGSKQDVINGLEAGADDYLTKPLDKDLLHARIKVGVRLVGLQAALAAAKTRIQELEAR